MGSTGMTPGPSEGGRITLGRGPTALRFGLTLLVLLMAAVLLALAQQWVWSILMIILLALLIVAVVFWTRSK